MFLNTADIPGASPRKKDAEGARMKISARTIVPVEGSSPKRKVRKLKNKPDHNLDTSDIYGTKPSYNHGVLNRPSYNLDVSDIKGTKPDAYKFKTDRYWIAPSNPAEGLSHWEIPQSKPQEPYPEPKFKRDSMFHDDIKGSRPKQYKVYDKRDKMDLSDIPGAHPKRSPARRRGQEHDQIMSDVSKRTKSPGRAEKFNPLEPHYKIMDSNGELIDYGFIPKSKPITPYYRKDEEERIRYINTKDIKGAYVDRRPKSPGRPIVYTGDIEGASPTRQRLDVIRSERDKHRTHKIDICH